MKRSFNALMEKNRILIWNAEDPVIKARILPFGYNSKKINEGKALFTEVETLAKAQKKEYAEQFNVSSEFIEKQELEENKFRSIRKYCKFLFKTNQEAYTTLALDTAIPTNFADWMQVVLYFYERLQEHPEWINAMQPFGIAENVASETLTRLAELKDLQELRKRETGDAQRATQARNEKYDELKEWCATLRELAKILFDDDDAQYLEKLGIISRN